MNIIKEVKKLKFPKNQFAVFGSGPLGVRGIRKSKDIDILASKKLWNKLAEKYPVKNEKLISIGKIEIYKHWLPWFKNTEALIKSSDVIKGVRFVNLKNVIKWKKAYNREKDKKDIKLIKEYLKNKNA